MKQKKYTMAQRMRAVERAVVKIHLQQQEILNALKEITSNEDVKKMLKLDEEE